MNEVNTTADFRPEPPVDPAARQPASEMRALVAALTQGENALARRKDLGEMHKRLVSLVGTMGDGLTQAGAARSAADSAEIVARLDQLERAVNSMEGALRIELEPMLRSMLQDIVAGKAAKRPRALSGMLAALVLAAVSVGIGAVFADRIGFSMNSAVAAFNEISRSDSTESPPDGGIATASNWIK